MKNYKNYKNKESVPNLESFEAKEEAREMNNLYRNFFGRGEHRFAIYPSYWDNSWGKAPLLGIVCADDEFLAERLAYDKGILNPFNCTFQPKIKNIGVNKFKSN